MNYKEKLYDLIQFPSKLNNKDKWNIISFIQGYLKGSEENQLILDLIRIFLDEKYGIDQVLNTWEQQIEHYCYIKKLSWGLGFSKLIEEIIENDKFEFPIPDQFNCGKKIDLGIQIDGIELKEIKIGSVIQLSDKLNDEYKKTLLYDGTIKNPNWELFYSSDHDFKSIVFHNKEQENNPPVIWTNVPRIFSKITSEVIDIRESNNKIYIFTELFRIDIELALKKGELILKDKISYSENDKKLIENLSEVLYLYRVGAFNIPKLNTFEKLIASETLKLTGTYYTRSWQKYYKGSDGNWIKIKTEVNNA